MEKFGLSCYSKFIIHQTHTNKLPNLLRKL